MPNLTPRLGKFLEYLGVFSFFLVYEYLLWLWLGLNRFNLYDDSAAQFFIALNIFKNLSHPGAIPLYALFNTAIYPPLVYVISCGFFVFWGVWAKIAIISQAPFILALIIGLYGLCRKLYNPSLAAVITFITLTSPMVIFISKFYLLDLPLTAMTVLSVYCLALSSNFRHGAATLAFGLAVTLGMLTKFTLLLYISGPLLVSLWQLGSATLTYVMAGDNTPTRSEHDWIKAAWGNLAIILLSGVVFYLFSFGLGNINNFVRFLKGGNYALDRHFNFYWDNLIYYFIWLKNFMVLGMVFYLFCLGLAFTLSRKKLFARNAPLILSLVISCAALILVPISAPRFLLPVLPFIIIIACAWLWELKGFKWLILIPVLALSLLQWLGGLGSYYLPQYRYLSAFNPVSAFFNKSTYYPEIKDNIHGNLVTYARTFYWLPALDTPSATDWPHKSIADDILRRCEHNCTNYILIDFEIAKPSVALTSLLSLEWAQRFPEHPKWLYYAQFGNFQGRLFMEKISSGIGIERMNFKPGDRIFVIIRKSRRIGLKTLQDFFLSCRQREFTFIKAYDCPDREPFELYKLDYTALAE